MDTQVGGGIAYRTLTEIAAIISSHCDMEVAA